MASEISFGRLIRTSAKAQPRFPETIETVEQAIDHVQELPLADLDTDHWHLASEALWSAVDFPNDAARLGIAEKALCTALATEGWLDGIAPQPAVRKS